ncbi:MAG: S24 family peptidase [Syntrophobacteraceae bacterium]
MSTEMLNAAERIKLLRERLENITQADLARILGIPRHKIADIEFGKVKISVELAELLEGKFNVSFRWALTGKGDIFQPEPQDSSSRLSAGEYEQIPLLASRVTAGPEGEVLFEEIADYYPFKTWWIDRMVGNDVERRSRLVLIKVRGDSMSPTINQGDMVMIDTWEAERINIRTGQIYMVTMPDGGSALKRLALGEKEGKVKLICMSDNVAAYKPFEFELESRRPVHSYVIGRVRWVGKEID